MQSRKSRGRVAAIAMTALIVAVAPAAVSAAPLSFGTVSVGAIKSLTVELPLTVKLSDLPPSTVLYSGGSPGVDLAVQLAGLSIPVTAGAVFAVTGEVTGTFHLGGHLQTGTDFAVDASDCLTATGTCEATVTFQPTATGTRTDAVSWSASDVQVTGGGSFASMIQLLAPNIASSVASQNAVSLTGIGVPSTGSVNARVNIAASAACVELSTSAIDFGDQALGAMDVPATPTITVTNCSGTEESLYASGTNAAGPDSAWTLVDSTATCADTLGLDNYRLGLAVDTLPATIGLSTDNKLLQTLAPAEDSDHTARIYTACPGSSGAGVLMTMQLHYLVTGN